MKRAYNFNAGPAALPEWVLHEAKEHWLNFNDTGMSLMELSHRSKDYEAVHNEAKELLTSLLSIPDNYEILFLQGGASLQFTMIPMNLLPKSQTAYYALTGVWSEKAMKEASKLGNTAISTSSKNDNYTYIPDHEQINIPDDAAYLHITSNNTIFGTQWSSFPSNLSVPLIADMSSDILSTPIDVSQFGVIYAGAQKNLGPSGVTVVIIRKDLIKEDPALPTMLSYHTHAKNNSLFNTPPTLGIYLLSLVLKWVEKQGGVEGIAAINNEKAKHLYEVIDQSNGFYRGHAEKTSRSKMNVTFTLQSEDLTKDFLSEAKEAGFVGLNGHRSVGGCRASIYNAVPLEHVIALSTFMKDFQLKYQQ
ncbi:phosphoserine aminotransferase [Niallia circulans]|uniref:3-phosphoserine/phosphohydroxythreonine transaminase n=1 Tax=Niallia TaxID=2837506 RepID=UPI00077C7F35|nr:3-phosphoserine/phosphohydroxythreonine transaminase [Niallia circulans]MDR4315986.1 3-phosphoserine/phosphohydroxythreonine transaminase [Niallia circulans]MED3837680.1 3-phosphoserine/phosphohydroxythreonine transaminase [Niallia circulans]MED4244750.1 3-phosphoserine/phosphohydroxythreonine transaminase [Niallia circulans]MED4249766.1 3-phosphoserine/phosphohydroxythreonine transaminase [Niallia circulans]MED5103064.1 3-phosphoserine/phosphohydroxythreonine transaminase [Niallia circulan